MTSRVAKWCSAGEQPPCLSRSQRIRQRKNREPNKQTETNHNHPNPTTTKPQNQRRDGKIRMWLTWAADTPSRLPTLSRIHTHLADGDKLPHCFPSHSPPCNTSNPRIPKRHKPNTHFNKLDELNEFQTATMIPRKTQQAKCQRIRGCASRAKPF